MVFTFLGSVWCTEDSSGISSTVSSVRKVRHIIMDFIGTLSMKVAII